MTAQVVCALQQKGGACKSTMLQCIAGHMAKDGAKVMLIDTDEQQSCIDWAQEQELPNVDTLAHLDESTVIDIIAALRPRYDVILIDTAGFQSQMASYVMQAVDLILIPSGGSKSNVKGLAKTWQHARVLTGNNQTPPTIRTVLWGIKRNSNVYKHALATIQAAEIPVLSSHVGHLTGFEAMSWNGGLPVGAAATALNQFMGAMQTSGLLRFYDRDQRGERGAA